MRNSTRNMIVMIFKLLITGVMILCVWEESIYLEKPFESRAFWMLIGGALFTFAVSLLAFVGYVQARKRDKSLLK